MELNYDSFWFVLLVTIGIIFLSLAIFFGLKIAYAEEGLFPEKCIKYNDNKTVIIIKHGWTFFGPLSCNGYEETIAQFLTLNFSTVKDTYELEYMTR